MNKIEIVKYLITEIEEEQKLFTAYEEDEKQALKKAKENGDKYSYWHYTQYKGRRPSKNRITDNCKKVRQLMLDISKEC